MQLGFQRFRRGADIDADRLHTNAALKVLLY